MYRSPNRLVGPIRSQLDERAHYARVSAQFREMPGLRLTVAQAVYHFDIDRARCERVLSALVARGVLTTDGYEFSSARAGRRPV
jgi:hypothetical protein